MSTYPPQQAPKKPGIAGIVIAVVLMIFAPVVGVLLIVFSSVDTASDLTNAPSFTTAAETQVELTAGEEMGLWVTNFSWNCQILDPDGISVDIFVMGGGTQTIGRFTLGATFTPTHTGTHSIDCTRSTEPAEFKVAPPMNVGGMVWGIILGVFLIIGMVFAGIIVLIVSLIRRSKWNRTYGPAKPNPVEFTYQQDPPNGSYR